MEATDFLPKVIVTTIVWADNRIFEICKWESAQGDDLKNNRSTIELNLPRILDRARLEELAMALCEQWLAIYIIFATRQDLINKQARRYLSSKAEYLLCDAYIKVIMDSPQLARPYLAMAAKEILEGTRCIESMYQPQFSRAEEGLKEIAKYSEE